MHVTISTDIPDSPRGFALQIAINMLGYAWSRLSVGYPVTVRRLPFGTPDPDTDFTLDAHYWDRTDWGLIGADRAALAAQIPDLRHPEPCAWAVGAWCRGRHDNQILDDGRRRFQITEDDRAPEAEHVVTHHVEGETVRGWIGLPNRDEDVADAMTRIREALPDLSLSPINSADFIRSPDGLVLLDVNYRPLLGPPIGSDPSPRGIWLKNLESIITRRLNNGQRSNYPREVPA